VARNFRLETFPLRDAPGVFAGFSLSFTDSSRFWHRQASVILPIVQAPSRREVFPQQFEQELKGNDRYEKNINYKTSHSRLFGRIAFNRVSHGACRATSRKVFVNFAGPIMDGRFGSAKQRL